MGYQVKTDKKVFIGIYFPYQRRYLKRLHDVIKSVKSKHGWRNCEVREMPLEDMQECLADLGMEYDGVTNNAMIVYIDGMLDVVYKQKVARRCTNYYCRNVDYIYRPYKYAVKKFGYEVERLDRVTKYCVCENRVLGFKYQNLASAEK